MDFVPFNRPLLVGREHEYIDRALASGKISGNGEFAQACSRLLVERIGARAALIVPSCTAALEMSALLLDLEPGDEVILPSFTFVSTANAYALRGAVPVFVDIDAETLNIAPEAIEAAITPRTKAIVVVHYGGVGCDMTAIMEIAARHGDIPVIEDAAHALPAARDGRQLGSIGAMSTFSFHETKNVQCGEGGALVINDERFVEAAEIIQEKGTDRSRFFRGQVDKYTWQSVGSSYLLSEVAAAFLLAQLEHLDEITAARRDVWHRYQSAFETLERDGLVRRPVVPEAATHSGHLYYLLLPDLAARTAVIEGLGARGVGAVFHYVPLHDSPAGEQVGRASGSLEVTVDSSARLVRLPLWAGISDAAVDQVIAAVLDVVPEALSVRS